MLHDFSDTAHVGCSGGGVGVNDAETEVGLEECMHHHTVPELKDLKREDSAGEKDEGEREQRKLDDVVRLGGVGMVFLGE